MNNLPLQPLVWIEAKYSGGIATDAQGGAAYYRAIERDGKHIVYWMDNGGGSDGDKTFDSLDELKDWVNNTHYPHKMQPYVKPDSITDIRNWFKATKPEPTKKDVCTQVGVHYEEVAEMMEAMQGHDHRASQMMSSIADAYKMRHLSVDGIVESVLVDSMQPKDNIELLDALCDQIVTATGAAYMMGFDIESALKEVIRSNNSKMVNGKFEFDENGEIAKPDSYSKPDLTPFVKESDCE